MEAWITSTVNNLGNWGIAFLMFLENVFPPIPSELIMPLAGFTVGRGELSFLGVVIAGSAGSVAGQFPLYFLGRSIGRGRLKSWADAYGKWVLVSGEDIERAGDWLRRHGRISVFLCRLIPGLRSLISIPAGAARMNLWIFTAYSTLGIAIWSTFLAGLGYLLGNNYRRIQKYVGPVGTWIWVVLGIAFLAWIGWRLRRESTSSEADGPLGSDENQTPAS